MNFENIEKTHELKTIVHKIVSEKGRSNFGEIDVSLMNIGTPEALKLKNDLDSYQTNKRHKERAIEKAAEELKTKQENRREKIKTALKIAIPIALVVIIILIIVLTQIAKNNKRTQEHDITKIDIIISTKTSKIVESDSQFVNNYNCVEFVYNIQNNLPSNIKYIDWTAYITDTSGHERGYITFNFFAENNTNANSSTTAKAEIANNSYSANKEFFQYLYDTPLSQMRITYKITKVEFADGYSVYSKLI